MELLERQQDGWFILGIKGKLDSITSPEARAKLLALVQRGERKLLLDCTLLDYISSAGLRVLFEVAYQLQQTGGRLACCTINANVAKVFKAVELQAEIPVFATAEEALRAP